MDKSNVFISSPFYMWEGDVLNLKIIDETGVPATINLVSVSTPNVPDAGTPLPPVATAAVTVTYGVSDVTLSARWNASTLATGYYLTVATDTTFTTKVVGYDNKDVGNVLLANFIVPIASTTYYFRVSAYNTIGTSDYSNIIPVVMYSDWYLPSKDELAAIHTELFLHGTGNISISGYWSSSEASATTAWYRHFGSNTEGAIAKTYSQGELACRSFTSGADTYALRDRGPAGGYVFYKNGTNYIECWTNNGVVRYAPAWSNVNNVAIGTTSTAIGTGQANSTAIINQIGHTMSDALLVDRFIICQGVLIV